MLKIEKLTLRDTSKSKKILNRVDLDIQPNEIHCLLGKNGSGKTSLAYSIMGLNKDLIVSGKISFLGKNITKMTIPRRAQMGITLAFQEPARFEGLLVEDYLALSNKKGDRNELKKVLELLGLNNSILKRKLDDKLSGGERKRIELAAVVLMKPELMILDEPDASLDIIVYNELYDLLLKIKKTLNCSILLITHREEAGLISDKATLIEKGEIISTGKFRSVMLEYCKRSKTREKCISGRKARNK